MSFFYRQLRILLLSLRSQYPLFGILCAAIICCLLKSSIRDTTLKKTREGSSIPLFSNLLGNKPCFTKKGYQTKKRYVLVSFVSEGIPTFEALLRIDQLLVSLPCAARDNGCASCSFQIFDLNKPVSLVWYFFFVKPRRDTCFAA